MMISAVFASYTNQYRIPLYIFYYIEALFKVVDRVVFVADYYVCAEDVQKLKSLGCVVVSGRHGEYDFGSYKRGYLYLKDNDLLFDNDYLVFCNDSCYGPITSFETIFDSAKLSAVDIYGMTESFEYSHHVQSYFLIFKKSFFVRKEFENFILNVKRENNVEAVIKKYEVGLGVLAEKMGARINTVVPAEGVLRRGTVTNCTCFPIECMKFGSELIKVKTFTDYYQRGFLQNNVYELLLAIRSQNSVLCDLILKDLSTR